MEQIRDLRNKQFFMVNDEYLNGYAKLCGINATGVYFSMCRHANKEQQCFPSKKLIAEELDISERSVYSAIKELSDWNIIAIEEQGRKKDGSFKVRLYTLLDKKYWKSKPQANGAVGKDCTSPQANDDTDRRHLLPNKGTHIEGNTIKETHTTDVKPLMELFDKMNPMLNWGNKTIRKSAADLIKRFGMDATLKMAEQIIAVQGQPYAPVCTTPHQMKEKLAQFKIYFDSKKTKSTMLKV